KDYSNIIDGRLYAALQEYLSEEHTFAQHKEFLQDFASLEGEIQSLSSTEHLDLVTVDCEDLKRSLVERSRSLCHLLLVAVIEEHKVENHQICRLFELIKEKADNIPKTTEELFTLSHYMEEVRTKKMGPLRQRVQDSASRLMYLIDRFIFNEADMAMNSQVLTWPDRIMPIFDANDLMMEEARREGELKLIEARNKLVNDLARLHTRVEEFCDYGELHMIQHYVHDTRAVQKKLAELANQIEWIHKEESMYKFPTTEYPEWDAISTALEPFAKFFNTVLKWQRCEK
ncbi:hypothetical protein EGW08_006227, partial [Elysia chlorotica]